MTTICVAVEIAAPPERCFDLARDVDLHVQSATRTRERAVGGITTGLLTLGDTVTWQALHFWLPWRLTAQITRYDRPRLFEDRMLRGPFHALIHTHRFEPADPAGTRTLMTDTLRYTAPLGPLGALADRLFLTLHMRDFLLERTRFLKRAAETGSVLHHPLRQPALRRHQLLQ